MSHCSILRTNRRQDLKVIHYLRWYCGNWGILQDGSNILLSIYYHIGVFTGGRFPPIRRNIPPMHRRQEVPSIVCRNIKIFSGTMACMNFLSGKITYLDPSCPKGNETTCCLCRPYYNDYRRSRNSDIICARRKVTTQRKTYVDIWFLWYLLRDLARPTVGVGLDTEELVVMLPCHGYLAIISIAQIFVSSNNPSLLVNNALLNTLSRRGCFQDIRSLDDCDVFSTRV